MKKTDGKIKLGITGLGLIGASILKALYKNDDYEIFCHSNSSCNKALEYSNNASADIKILSGCDVVFVCCEISKTLSVLDELNLFLGKDTLVVDCASVKSNLLNKKYNFDFILSHPMAGSEKSGFDAGYADLFKDNRWLIEKNNNTLEKIIKDTGAVPLKINMESHDFMCAQISHLPTLLSFLLFDCASCESKEIASSGFRDTTRLAMTNSSLILGMLKNNEKNIQKAFDRLIEKLNCLKKMKDSEKIELFSEIAQKRAKMYDENGKNIFKI